MRRKQLKFYFLIVIFFFGFTQALAGTSETIESPEKMLRQVTDTMIFRLNKEKNYLQKDPNFIYKLVEELLVPHADFTEMSKRVLSMNWRNATELQRKDFEKQFKILVIRTYATAFRAYKDERVEIVGARYGHTNTDLVEVNTLIKQISGPDIIVNYRMIKRKEGWKVYDMNVEGVSLVNSFASQFTDSIRLKGLDLVIQEIYKRNKESLTRP